ncbi:hypothetical protein FRC20_002107 [Serendipita sp. 405]|nr:hypothetical protein FRC15_004088 [Serendipita sp. 397]KAG8781423.1 hypothetical protein FRC16_002855 [Serendipita sp. 398]KAG8850176.1 hypothetical protein FRC20_002107 [Serendipita sp. 405]
MQVQETQQNSRPLLAHRRLAPTEDFSKSDVHVYQRPNDDDIYQEEKGLPTSSGRPRRWNEAVKLSTWPRILYVVVGLVLIIIWIGVMIAFAREEVKAQQRNLEGDTRTRTNRTANQLVMKGTLKNFDPVERSLVVSWGLTYVDGDNKSLRPLGDTEDTSFAVNIYRDVKVVFERRPLTPEANQTIQQLGIAPPDLRIDNATVLPNGVLGLHTWDGLDTSIDFTQAVEDNPWKQPLFGYPFDVWAGSIVFAATDREYAEAANLTNTYAFGLDGAVLADSTLNWRIRVENSNNTCDYSGEFAGCELHVDFTGKRPLLVKFAAILAVLVNWTSTIGIFLLTCEAVIMRRVHILSETDILGVCLTALFALPSVRAILPGAPDFGAILDLVGVIPNIIIISVCTTMMALAKLTTRKPPKEE